MVERVTRGVSPQLIPCERTDEAGSGLASVRDFGAATLPV
jgi:hypothetical protein